MKMTNIAGIELGVEQRRIGAAALVAILVGGALRLLCVPAWVRLGARGAELRDLQAQVAQARQVAAELPLQQAALRDEQARYENLERRIRGGQSVARVLETLSAQAKQDGVELVALQPHADAQVMPVMMLGPSMRFRGVPLTLQLTGRYRALGEFLGTLPQSPLFATVHRLTMTRLEAGSPRLRAELEMTLYLPQQETGP